MVHARHRHMVRQSPRRRHDAGASGKLGRIPDAASCSSDFDVFDVGATPSQAEVMASPAELMVSHNLGGGVPRRATWSHPARGRASQRAAPLACAGNGEHGVRERVVWYSV